MIHTAAAAFAEVASGRLGGLDVGTKTIGLATCDATWSFATPAETIRRTKFGADLALLKAFVARHALAGLVVGLPLNLDGSDSPAHPVGSRLRPQPRSRSTCHCCCGTSAGRRSRSSGR